MSRLRITIDSDLDELFLVSMVVRGVCARLGLDDVQRGEVELCAVEAVTNVIRHAYHKELGHEVSVSFSFTPERLDLSVWDHGNSMPMKQVNLLREGSPVLEFDPEILSGVPEGGMGLEIIRQLSDEISYSSEGGANCLRISKFFNPAPVKDSR